MTVEQRLRSSADRVLAAADEIPVPDVADLVPARRRRPVMMVAAALVLSAAVLTVVLLGTREVTESVATEPSVPELATIPPELDTYDPDHLELVMRSAPDFAGAELVNELQRAERADLPSVEPLVFAGLRGPFFTEHWDLASGGSYTVTTVRPEDLDTLLANLTHDRVPTDLDEPAPGARRWEPELVGDQWVIAWEDAGDDIAVVVTATAAISPELVDAITASTHATAYAPASTDGRLEGDAYRGVWVLDDVAWVGSLTGPTALDAVIGTAPLLEIAGGLLGEGEHDGRRYLNYAVVDHLGYANYSRRIGEIESFPAFDATSVVQTADWQVSLGPLSRLDEAGEDTYVFGIAPEGSVRIRLVFEDGSVVESELDQPPYGVSSIFVPIDPSPTGYDAVAVDALDDNGAVLASWRA